MLTIQRIEELINGAEIYLQKIDQFSNSLKSVKQALEELKNSQESSYMMQLEKMRYEMSEIKNELQKRGLPEISQYELLFKVIKEMVYSDEWPRSVDPKAICVSEQMAFERAQSILDLVVAESLNGKSFLDYGCGEGHVVMHALKQDPKISLGYDINKSKIKFDNEHFTSEFDVVAKHAPFDIILLQDVLDHLEFENAVDVLIKLKSILRKEGRIYIRCHPWCSRHGSHLYTQLNKAFVHLVCDESELSRMNGYVNDYTIKLYNPIETYKKWFEKSGFKISSEVVITKNVEKYFENNGHIKERLVKHWNGDETQMKNNMQIEFVEYVLDPILNQEII